MKIGGTLAGVSAYTDVAGDIADRICAAVTTSSAVYTALDEKKRKAPAKDAPPAGATVNDVPVQGRFVTKR